MPCPRKFAAVFIHLHNTNSKTRKGQQNFAIYIISGEGAALSNPKTHSPIP